MINTVAEAWRLNMRFFSEPLRPGNACLFSLVEQSLSSHVEVVARRLSKGLGN
jgi:hypothetical protein